MTALATVDAPAAGAGAAAVDRSAEVVAGLAALRPEQLAALLLDRLDLRQLWQLVQTVDPGDLTDLVGQLDRDVARRVMARFHDAFVAELERERPAPATPATPPSNNARKRRRRAHAYLDHRRRRDDRPRLLYHARWDAAGALDRAGDRPGAKRTIDGASACFARAFTAERSRAALTAAALEELLDAIAAAAQLDRLEHESRPPPGVAVSTLLVGALAAAPGAPPATGVEQL